MKTVIQLYGNLKEKVKSLCKQLRLDELEKTKGLKLAITPIDSITLGVFKHQKNSKEISIKNTKEFFLPNQERI